jgi:hypothetical protein
MDLMCGRVADGMSDAEVRAVRARFGV